MWYWLIQQFNQRANIKETYILDTTLPVFAAFRRQKIIPNSHSDVLSLSDSFLNESMNRFKWLVQSQMDSLINSDVLPPAGDLISLLKSIFIF